jgi:hypothetical protein
MEQKLIIEVLAVSAIIYELIKMIFVEKYWTFGLSLNKIKRGWSLFLYIADSVYTGLMIGLLFTPYFVYGITILTFSGLTAYLLHKEYFTKEPLNKRIMIIILSDSIASVVILTYLLCIL